MPVCHTPLKKEQVDQLKVRVYEDREKMGLDAAKAVSERIKHLLAYQETVRVVFAAAPSQNEFLKYLVADQTIDWSRLTAFHMDEYIGLESSNPQRFSHFLNEHLFKLVKPGNVHLIDSSNEEEEECKRYAKLIQESPIDIVCLGIGENGHIAFNDPPAANFQDSAVIKSVELDEDCRQQQVNDGCFPDFNSVPTHALTLTIPILMSGRHLFCIVPGPTKRAAVHETLKGTISTECPASILRTHTDCTLYLDLESYEERV